MIWTPNSGFGPKLQGIVTKKSGVDPRTGKPYEHKSKEDEDIEFVTLPECNQSSYGTCRMNVIRGDDVRCAAAKTMTVSCEYKGLVAPLKSKLEEDKIKKMDAAIVYRPSPKLKR